MNSSIILISPPGAGKTTIGQLLHERLDWNIYDLDDKARDYYKEKGVKISDFGNSIDPRRQPYKAHAVKRFLEDHQHESCILSFGVGHSTYEEPNLSAQVQAALAPYNVVLLLPSDDIEESIRLLNEWNNAIVGRRDTNDPKLNEYVIRHPSNRTLARFVVFRKDKSPEETCDEIVALIRASPAHAAAGRRLHRQAG